MNKEILKKNEYTVEYQEYVIMIRGFGQFFARACLGTDFSDIMWCLSDTLKKLLLTQDVFATTNYDRLLECATGLSTLSYEEPDKVFCMLDKKSEAVLHIHGVYDSIHGVDNVYTEPHPVQWSAFFTIWQSSHARLFPLTAQWCHSEKSHREWLAIHLSVR